MATRVTSHGGGAELASGYIALTVKYGSAMQQIKNDLADVEGVARVSGDKAGAAHGQAFSKARVAAMLKGFSDDEITSAMAGAKSGTRYASAYAQNAREGYVKAADALNDPAWIASHTRGGANAGKATMESFEKEAVPRASRIGGIVGAAIGTPISLGIKGVNAAFGEVEKVGISTAKKVGGSFKNAFTNFAPIAGLSGALFGIGESLNKGFEQLSAVEDAEAKMRGFGKTGEQIEETFKRAHAVLDPLGISIGSAADSLQRLVQQGVEGDKLTSMLQTAADAAAVMDKPIGDAVTMMARWRDEWQQGTRDLRQFATTIPGLREELEKETQLTPDQLDAAFKAGDINADKMDEALANLTKGQAERHRNTISGQMQAIGTEVGNIFNHLLDPFIGDSGQGLEGVIKKFQDIDNWIQNHQDEIKNWFNDAKTVAGDVVTVLKDVKGILDLIPGGVNTVFWAFVAWEGIKGVASIWTGISGIIGILGEAGKAVWKFAGLVGAALTSETVVGALSSVSGGFALIGKAAWAAAGSVGGATAAIASALAVPAAIVAGIVAGLYAISTAFGSATGQEPSTQKYDPGGKPIGPIAPINPGPSVGGPGFDYTKPGTNLGPYFPINVQPNAQGGFTPKHAMIQSSVGPAGLIQWAEPSTGGEAYIPLGPANRKRSTEIWARTGRMLGAMAGGGMHFSKFHQTPPVIGAGEWVAHRSNKYVPGGFAKFDTGGVNISGADSRQSSSGILQIIWDNTATGQKIGEAGGQLVGPGTSQPGYYSADWGGHTGHVHTSFATGPNGEFYGLKKGTDIRQGQSGFPPWVYALGQQFGLEASTYAGHQEASGFNRGIDWWPAKHADMSGGSYNPQERSRLTAFASYMARMATGGQWGHGAMGATRGRSRGYGGYRLGPGAPGEPSNSGGQLGSGVANAQLWNAVMPHEGGTWNNPGTGGPHYGGLQFAQGTWNAFGGQEFAPRADMATPEQQMEVANRTAFTGYNGTPPQGLQAWEAITKGSVPGVTTATQSQGYDSPFNSGSYTNPYGTATDSYGYGYSPLTAKQREADERKLQKLHEKLDNLNAEMNIENERQSEAGQVEPGKGRKQSSIDSAQGKLDKANEALDIAKKANADQEQIDALTAKQQAAQEHLDSLNEVATGKKPKKSAADAQALRAGKLRQQIDETQQSIDELEQELQDSPDKLPGSKGKGKGGVGDLGSLADIFVNGLKESFLPPGFIDYTQSPLAKSAAGGFNYLSGIFKILGSAVTGSGSGVVGGIADMFSPNNVGSPASAPGQPGLDLVEPGSGSLPLGMIPTGPLPGPGGPQNPQSGWNVNQSVNIQGSGLPPNVVDGARHMQTANRRSWDLQDIPGQR